MLKNSLKIYLKTESVNKKLITCETYRIFKEHKISYTGNKTLILSISSTKNSNNKDKISKE